MSEERIYQELKAIRDKQNEIDKKQAELIQRQEALEKDLSDFRGGLARFFWILITAAFSGLATFLINFFGKP